MAQLVKNLPAKNLPAMQETQETQFQSLGWEEPLEKEMAIHSSIIDRKVPGAEKSARLEYKGSQRV